MSFIDEFNTLVYSVWYQGIGWLQSQGFNNPEIILIAVLVVSVFMLLLAVGYLLGRSRPRRHSRAPRPTPPPSIKFNIAQARQNPNYQKW